MKIKSTFSSVNVARTTETLALDQFDVPAVGTGGSFTTLWDDGGKWTLSAGTDARLVTGETNENVGTYSRRVAGGEQSVGRIFSAGSFQASENTHFDGSARLDRWQLNDGQRKETSLTTGNLLRDDDIRDRGGVEPSAAFEMSHQLEEGLVATLSAGSAFRLPTLNELHRPFRVRNDIVEANPELDTERFFSTFAGYEYGGVQYDDALATREVVDFHTVRIGATWQTATARYQVRIENLFDQTVQTGLSSDGIETASSSWSLWVGAEWDF